MYNLLKKKKKKFFSKLKKFFFKFFLLIFQFVNVLLVTSSSTLYSSMRNRIEKSLHFGQRDTNEKMVRWWQMRKNFLVEHSLKMISLIVKLCNWDKILRLYENVPDRKLKKMLFTNKESATGQNVIYKQGVCHWSEMLFTK